MDYIYFGSSSVWPLTSTIASVAGLVLIFGQKTRRGSRSLSHLALADFTTLKVVLTRFGVIWLPCVALLVLPLAIPESSWLATLRGRSQIDTEIDLARTDGYYEELNRTATDRRQPTIADRPAGRRPFTESGLLDEVTDYRRRVLRANLDTRWNERAFRTNSLGYRSPEISLKKPPGTFRVVLLGSSNSMGHGVDEEETYARRLERWLNDKAGQGVRVEVVNLAVSGDSPTQQLYRLQFVVPPLEPDWILNDITALDFSLEEQHLRWVVETRPEIPYDFVASVLKESGVNPGDSSETFHQKLSPFLKPMLDRTYEAWSAEAQRLEIPLTVVILPRADSKTESPSLFQLFRDLAHHHGLRSTDLSDAFDRYELDEYRIAPWDHHPNSLGHQLIFERLRDLLIVDHDFWNQVRTDRN